MSTTPGQESPWNQAENADQPRSRPAEGSTPDAAGQQRPSSPQQGSAAQKGRGPKGSGSPQPGAQQSGKQKTEKRKTGKKKAVRQRGPREDGRPHDWTLFRAVVALYGALIAAYAVWQVLLGSSSLPGAEQQVDSTIAAAYGGMAAVLCGVGLAFIAIAVKFQWANMLGFVCATVFLGGIGRILAWAFFGLPDWTQIVLMVLDLVIPPCLLVWYGWVTKANRIRREMSGNVPGTKEQRGAHPQSR